MASSSSDTENGSCQTDDSDWNYIPGPHIKGEPTEVETSLSEHNTASASAMSNDHDEQDLGPYADEPIADEEWLAKFIVKILICMYFRLTDIFLGICVLVHVCVVLRCVSVIIRSSIIFSGFAS